MFILLILKKKNCLLQFYEKSALRRKCILWWKKDDLPCINFCVCVSVALLQWWKPTQTSYQYATSIIFLWRIYVWLCYQDMSQGKFDAVPFFELKISQVASCSLKSPLSPKAAIPFTGKSTALLFASPCPLPSQGVALSSPSAVTQFTMEKQSQHLWPEIEACFIPWNKILF